MAEEKVEKKRLNYAESTISMLKVSPSEQE